MGETGRRSFIAQLIKGGAALLAAATVDPDKLLWVPGAKTFLIPNTVKPVNYADFVATEIKASNYKLTGEGLHNSSLNVVVRFASTRNFDNKGAPTFDEMERLVEIPLKQLYTHGIPPGAIEISYPNGKKAFVNSRTVMADVADNMAQFDATQARRRADMSQREASMRAELSLGGLREGKSSYMDRAIGSAVGDALQRGHDRVLIHHNNGVKALTYTKE